ncbi:type II secretion system protein [Thermodesulfobacteriota bacterium]
MALVIIRDKKGFTLVELIVSMGILFVLISTTIPVVSAYRMKAQSLELDLTIKHLMDGMEVCYVENDEFYPEVTGSWFIQTGEITVESGETADIPDILYEFPAGHRHKYIFRRWKLDWGEILDLVWIEIWADFDFNRNGVNDRYTIYMWMRDGQPYSSDRYRHYELVNGY